MYFQCDGLFACTFAFKLLTDAVNTDAVLIIYLLFVGKIPTLVFEE